MSSTSDIKIVLELDDKNFSVEMSQAGKVIKSFGQQVRHADTSMKHLKKSTTSLMPKIRDLSVVIGLARHALVNLRAVTWDWQQGIINANAEIERMTMLLRGMSTAASEEGKLRQAASDVDYLIQTAQRAPFAINELTNSFVKFKSVGLDPLDGSFKALVDSVAAFGGSEQILHRASVAIQQMAGKGIISMEELRQQLGEAVPTAIPLMARAMNLTVQQMIDAISKGQVEAKPALERMFAEFERTMGGSSDRMMTTWNGMISQLKTQWFLFLVEIGESEYFAVVKEQLGSLIDVLKSNEVKELASDIGRGLAVATEALIKFAIAIKDNWKWVKALLAAMIGLATSRIIIAGITAIGTTFKALSATMSMAVGQASMFSAAMVGQATAMQRVKDLALASGLAFKTMLGPIFMVISAVVTFALTWESTADKIEDAEERILQSTQNISKTTIDLVNEGIKARKQEITDLENTAKKQIETIRQYEKEIESGGARGRNLRSRMATLARLKEEHEMTLAQIVETGRSTVELENKKNEALINNLDQYMGERKKVLDRGMKDQLTAAQSEYNVISTEQAKLFAEGEISSKQFRQNMLDAKLEFYDAELFALQDVLASEEAILENSTGNQADIIAASVANLKERIDAVRKSIGMAYDHYKEFELTAGSTGAKSNPFLQYLQGLEGKVAKQTADLQGLNGELAKFESLLTRTATGYQYKGVNVSEADIQKVRDLTQQYVDLKNATELQTIARKRASKILREMSEKESYLKETMKDMAIVIQDEFDPRSPALRRIEGMRDELWRLAEAGLVSYEVLSRGLEMVNRAAEQQSNVDSAERILEYREASREAVASLMTERDAITYRYEFERKALEARRDYLSDDIEWQKKEKEQLNAYLIALDLEYFRAIERPMVQQNREWQNMLDRMQESLTTWAEEATDVFVEFAKTGKFEFGKLIDSILEDILRLAIQKAVIGPLFEQISMLMDMVGTSGGGGGWSAIGQAIVSGFANGGIMTDKGSLPLRSYASGGIADFPQLAMFGEGSTPEAYVPLPDGKSIPVKNMGGSDIQLNIINQSGNPVEARKQGEPRFDGQKMILDVVLDGVSRPGPFRDSMKGAMR